MIQCLYTYMYVYLIENTGLKLKQFLYHSYRAIIHLAIQRRKEEVLAIVPATPTYGTDAVKAVADDAVIIVSIKL